MRRRRVTTSRCLILPLETEHSVRPGPHWPQLPVHPTVRGNAANTPETAHTRQTDPFQPTLPRGHILTIFF